MLTGPASCILADHNLVQGHWKPEHLHWQGIDQILMQGQALPADAVTSPTLISDLALNSWLDVTAGSSHQQMSEDHQHLPSGSATGRQRSDPTAAASSAHDRTTAHHASQAGTDADQPSDVYLDSSVNSGQWFDKLDVAALYKQWARSVTEGRSGQGGLGGGVRCWGPAPPPQYAAMLRGELALAVMSGVAGKSLLKEVSLHHQYLLRCWLPSKCAISLYVLSCTLTLHLQPTDFSRLVVHSHSQHTSF